MFHRLCVLSLCVLSACEVASPTKPTRASVKTNALVDGVRWELRAKSPVPRGSDAMVYVPTRDKSLLVLRGDSTTARVWEWDGSIWTGGDLEPIRLPMEDFELVYDSRRDRVVLVASYFDVMDTEEWDGYQWVRRSLEGPPWRLGHAIAYDSGRGVTVLFGGSTFNDTWEWDGTSWTQRLPAGPVPAIGGGLMAYDAARSVTVLLGPDGTWEWNGTSWSQRVALTEPEFRAADAMVYDPVRARVVLFAGETGATWEWDGTTWMERTVEGPGTRSGHVLSYDTARSRVVLFGGSNGGDALQETWEWDGASWSLRMSTPPPMDSHAMAFDAARGEVVLYGGDETWTWNGTLWLRRIVASPPGERIRLAMAYDGARERVVLFGGHAPHQSPILNDTWEWDGTSWMRVSEGGPPPTFSGPMAYDSQRGVVVLFEGATRDVWEWDGSMWSMRTPLNRPPSCRDCSMAYDSVRGVAVVVGTFDVGVEGSATWLWDGTDWSQAMVSDPQGQIRAGLAYDVAHDRVVAIGGWSNYAGLYAWDGMTWGSYTEDSPGWLRSHTAMVYDAQRDVLVLFGGLDTEMRGVTYPLGDTWETVVEGSTCTTPECGDAGSGEPDAAALDAAALDAAALDAAASDAGGPDAATPDSGSPDDAAAGGSGGRGHPHPHHPSRGYNPWKHCAVTAPGSGNATDAAVWCFAGVLAAFAARRRRRS